MISAPILLGNFNKAGAEGGTYVPGSLPLVIPASQEIPTIQRSIQSRRMLLSLYFVDTKRTR